MTPRGCALAVRILRGWTADAARKRDTSKVLVGLDLANAFGRMRRPWAVSTMSRVSPELLSVMAMK